MIWGLIDWLLRQLLGWLLIWPALDDDIAAMTVPASDSLTAAMVDTALASMVSTALMDDMGADGLAATTAARVASNMACFG
jgi:hypothetical protein